MNAGEPRPGRIKCLKCSGLFDSRDVVTNRLCAGCNKENSREYVPRRYSSRVYPSEGGGTTPVDHDDSRGSNFSS